MSLFAEISFYAVVSVSILALLNALFLAKQTFRQSHRTSKAQEIVKAIEEVLRHI